MRFEWTFHKMQQYKESANGTERCNRSVIIPTTIDERIKRNPDRAWKIHHNESVATE